MTSAAFTIIWTQIQLEWHSIILCSIGSVGIAFGFEFLDHLLTGALTSLELNSLVSGDEKKMLFVSILVFVRHGPLHPEPQHGSTHVPDDPVLQLQKGDRAPLHWLRRRPLQQLRRLRSSTSAPSRS
ncbi:hypothetical protein L596_001987 [Steinernema carpocapsae]|uniref:Uncharacterized protein n=1 Tax=Steinernema carpocapsae TaxID=34508 RepID=A0A4U8UQI5_STECR|nr:hypothetical protein L596_001987 [Steinernema carpocapsae]